MTRLAHKLSLPVLILGLCPGSTGLAQEVVFDNTAQYLGYYRPQSGEFGDELNLAGTARLVTDFSFEYFARFTPQGDEFARIRFYANDGVTLSPYYTAPGTLLYESDAFPVRDGFSNWHLGGLNVVVPDRFTWTIEFQGLTMRPDDLAGLLYDNPVTVGQSYGDYWWKNEQGNWLPFHTRGLHDNFSARVLARVVPESTPRILSLTPAVAGQYRIVAQVLRNRDYALETSTPQAPGVWSRLRTILRASETQLTFIVPGGESARLFRVRELARKVSFEQGPPVITAKAIPGATYTLEFKDDLLSTNWSRLPDFLTATSDLVSIPDLTTPAPASRFYRIVEPNNR